MRTATLVLVMSALVAFAPAAWADPSTTYTTWEGDESANWNTAGNWDNGVPNSNGVQAIFPTLTGFTGSQPTLDVNNRTVETLRFEDAGGGWTLSGTGMVLKIQPSVSSGGDGNNAIEDLATSGTTTIHPDLYLVSWGPFPIVLNGARLEGQGLKVTRKKSLSVSDGTASFGQLAIDGDGYMRLAGNGTLELRGAHDGSLTSACDIQHTDELTLILGASDAIGSAVYVPSDNSVLEASTDVTLDNEFVFRAQFSQYAHHFAGDNGITFNGTLTPPSPGGTAVTIDCNIDTTNRVKKLLFTGDMTLTDRPWDFVGDGDVEFSGDLSGTTTARSLTRGSGDGTLILSGANTYMAPTQVTDGTLLITGSVEKTSDLTITGGVLDLSSAGLIRVLQSNYTEADALADIGASKIVADVALGASNVSTYNDGGTNYTQILVPEPATLGLLAVGGLAVIRRRRR